MDIFWVISEKCLISVVENMKASVPEKGYFDEGRRDAGMLVQPAVPKCKACYGGRESERKRDGLIGFLDTTTGPEEGKMIKLSRGNKKSAQVFCDRSLEIPHPGQKMILSRVWCSRYHSSKFEPLTARWAAFPRLGHFLGFIQGMSSVFYRTRIKTGKSNMSSVA